MLVIMKVLLSGYDIDLSTIHKTWNTKEMCLFANASSGLFLYNTLQCAFFPQLTMAATGRQSRPLQVGAWYGWPVAQKIAIGLL